MRAAPVDDARATRARDEVDVSEPALLIGLEFHGVFLVDFDQLQSWDAELAAEFLGVTVRETLPPQIASVAPLLSSGNWSDFGTDVDPERRTAATLTDDSVRDSRASSRAEFIRARGHRFGT